MWDKMLAKVAEQGECVCVRACVAFKLKSSSNIYLQKRIKCVLLHTV